mmetsp:Transcript_8322/g.25799  ORF Transcript_8322/g.25799 Transcript_8322/m.25799 type:complete len:203 (+) Transcript_8322:416-1024(+)
MMEHRLTTKPTADQQRCTWSTQRTGLSPSRPIRWCVSDVSWTMLSLSPRALGAWKTRTRCSRPLERLRAKKKRRSPRRKRRMKEHVRRRNRRPRIRKRKTNLPPATARPVRGISRPFLKRYVVYLFSGVGMGVAGAFLCNQAYLTCYEPKLAVDIDPKVLEIHRNSFPSVVTVEFRMGLSHKELGRVDAGLQDCESRELLAA